MKCTAVHHEGNASANCNNKKRETVKKAPTQAAEEQGKAEPAYLTINMLPNELLSNILLQHLDHFGTLFARVSAGSGAFSYKVALIFLQPILLSLLLVKAIWRC